jgi:hypothetical protein
MAARAFDGHFYLSARGKRISTKAEPVKAGERMRRPSEKIPALEASFLLRTEGSNGLDKESFTFYNK